MNDGLLRRVVDITWGRACEDESVPSSEIVTEIVAKAHADMSVQHVSDGMVELAAVAISREGFPKGRESARDYRLRLARAAINAALACG